MIGTAINKYEWKKRVTFQSIYIEDKEIHKYCSNNSKNVNFNKLNLNLNCLKQKNYDYLFFIEGDSHTAQYVNPLNNIKNLTNIYFKSANNYLISEELIINISKHYNKIFYITDINNIEKLRKIKNSKIFNVKNIEFIFFNSTPFIYENINPQYCLSRQIECFINKKIDFNMRNLSKLNSELDSLQKSGPNIHKFDSYKTLCPLDKCIIYDKKRDKLYYMDKTHLSTEGSLFLKDSLEEFLTDIIKLNIDKYEKF